VTLPVELGGRELWLSFVAVRTERGIVYTFRDLTFDRGLEAAKSDFIATVSHELRTPMTAVLGAAKTLLRDDIQLTPERRHQLLEMIGAQGTRLTQITEEVLLANRLDRGDLRIDSERVDLAELARDAVDAMREQLPESVSLSADLASNGDAAALGDRETTASASPRPSRNRSSRSSTGRIRSTGRRPAARGSGSTSAASSCTGWAARSASAPLPVKARRSTSSSRSRDVRHVVEHADPLLGSADTVPIYEYVCMECESHFEELVRNGEEPD
jgi:signal transduction histidine kinase